MNKNWIMPGGTIYKWHEELLSQKHLMIAGASGSGKSVLLNGIIYEALFSMPCDAPGGKQFIFLDQKGHELDLYKELPHTLRYAVDPQETVSALEYAVNLMLARDKYMSMNHLRMYNGGDVYIFIDEFADLMTTCKKAVLPLFQRLSQLGRSARIHLFLCTQNPIVKIIPSEVKCNFDSVVGLHTANAQQSRNIIDTAGCEDLEIGEALFRSPARELTYVHGIPLFPDEVIEQRVKWWTDQTRPAFAWPQRTGFLRRMFKKTV